MSADSSRYCNMKKSGELLAPAGNRESLVAAVEGGADAVYIGGSNFSARAFAGNFSEEDMLWAVDYCHLRNVKIYTAINTLVSDKEFDLLAEYIAFVNNIGIDAIIVQDIGVAVLARDVAPGLSLHASTQATVYDTDGALYFQDLGFKRAVVARELSVDKIKKIIASVNMEIEMFVHGAICVCYSGQCLMSSFIGGRSGNKGKCAQPCRLPYKTEGREGFLLSPKDMCLVSRLDEIRRIGAASLKIEGRMKGAEYVGTVTSIYKKYLDSGIVSKDDYAALERVFYRGGFTDAYFAGRKGSDMFCYDKPDNPYEKQKGAKYPYANERKTKIYIACDARLGKPLEITLSDYQGNTVACTGEINAQTAITKPLTCERLREQLSKLGDTVFELDGFECRTDDGISLPISEINSVRRKATELLNEKIIRAYKRHDAKAFHVQSGLRKPVPVLETAVQISSENQLNALNDDDYDYIYIPLDIAVKQKHLTDKTVVALPRITPDNIREALSLIPVKRALAANIGQVRILRALGYEIVIDGTLNVFNTIAARHFDFAKRITLSTELMLAQIKSITCKAPVEVVAYGRVALMITENCIIGSADGCKNSDGAKCGDGCNKTGFLTDRTGARFPVSCLSEGRNEILNSKPVVMSDKLNDIMRCGINVIRLVFTTESPDECKKIIMQYKNRENPHADFTRGKFYKGV